MRGSAVPGSRPITQERKDKGTRNLTCVVVGGEYKVAQYGQWDGYPSGQGLTALNFLRGMDREAFYRSWRSAVSLPKKNTKRFGLLLCQS